MMTIGDFDETQRQTIAALLNTVVPPSTDGRMPGAGALDFLRYLSEETADFAPSLLRVLDALPADFAAAEAAVQTAAVETFAARNPELFDALLFRIYACYYQNDVVRRLIGSQPGAPFPRGNTIPAGDLSTLEAVRMRGAGYRRL